MTKTCATVYSTEADSMVVIDLADPNTWPADLDLADLRDEAAIHGDTDLIATLNRLGSGL